jgi:hypothetical protein
MRRLTCVLFDVPADGEDSAGLIHAMVRVQLLWCLLLLCVGQVWSLGQPMPNFTLEGHEKGVNCVDYFTGWLGARSRALHGAHRNSCGTGAVGLSVCG